MATKPYISGSKYVRKMSDFGGGEWTTIWDGLFWRFVAKHRNFYAQNPRYKLSVDLLERMDNAKRERLLNAAENYLREFHA